MDKKQYRKKLNISKKRIKHWKKVNEEDLCLKFHFEVNNEKYQLSTIKIGENPAFKLNQCLEGETFWNKTNIYETMILKFSEFTGLYGIGYHVERHDTREEAIKRHKILKNLIEAKRYFISNSVNNPIYEKHMNGEFIFEE